MKLRISVGQLPRNGFINIDPSPKLGTSTYNNTIIHPINFKTLNQTKLIEDAECELIVLDNALSYLYLNEYKPFFSYLKSKLRLGGHLIVENIELNELIRAYYNNELDNEITLHELLYGLNTNSWTSYNSTPTKYLLDEMLSSELQLNIIEQKYVGLKYQVIGQRI